MGLHRTTRRRVLRIAATGGAVGALGNASAREAGPDGPGRYIVGTDSPRAERAAKSRADEVHRELDFGDIGRSIAGRFSEKAAERLANRADVRYVEPDGQMQAIETLPWGVDRVDADLAHEDGYTGGGGDISIIDTGIDSDHPDLEANLGTGKAYVDSTSGSEPWDDDNSHGTHCAGTADAVDNSEGVVGVSTAATLHAVKVLDSSGYGYYSDIAAGIEWTANQGYDVASLSLGGSSGSYTLQDACQYAVDNGVLVVAAAGNEGSADSVLHPAKYSSVVAISATTSSDDLAYFSSYGPEVELAAPGYSIYSTVPGGYGSKSGTSMACPHVAGAAGQLMAAGLSNTEARQTLRDTAEDIGLSANRQGYGLLDVGTAVDSLGSTDGTPSVSWVNPTDGETVSGTITVQIEASDSEDSDDSLDVTYSVGGGSSRSTSYNPDSGYYDDSIDTMGFSDGDHTFEANATDSAGNTSTSSITVTTDNSESAPAVDSLSASEVETSDSDAELDVDWSVSDVDGDLSSVDLTLTDDTAGETEDSASIGVSGDTASGTTRLVAAGDDGSGNSYTVDATVTDSNGNTNSDSTSLSETEDTSSAPTVDSFSVSTRTTGPWFRAESEWSVSDDDGDLNSVTTKLLDSGGNVLDSTSSDVSGSSASGTHEDRTRSNDPDSVKLTVTDVAGNSTSDTRSV